VATVVESIRVQAEPGRVHDLIAHVASVGQPSPRRPERTERPSIMIPGPRDEHNRRNMRASLAGLKRRAEAG